MLCDGLNGKEIQKKNNHWDICIEEPGGLQSTGLQRVRHDWATNSLMFISYKHLAESLGCTVEMDTAL